MGEAEDTYISLGQATMSVEAKSIADAAQKLGSEFAQAVQLIAEMSNSGKKLIFCLSLIHI